MHKDLTAQPKSSFLSYEKDIELILKKLFIDRKDWGDMLKRLLVINTEDCIDKQSELYNFYQNKIDKISFAELVQQGFIRLIPKISMSEHNEKKAYLLISMDDFVPNATNPEFRDCTVAFDIICHTDCWDMQNYQIRPLKIAGYIDGILNETRLTGIGKFHFMGCSYTSIDENLAGYTILYRAVHGTDDQIENAEE